MVKMLSGACAGYCVYCGENKKKVLSYLYKTGASLEKQPLFIYLFLQ